MKTSMKLFTYVVIAFSLTILSCEKEEEIVEQESLPNQTNIISKNDLHANVSKTFNEVNLSKGSLNLDMMLRDFKNQKRSYLMNVSTTAILNTGHVFPIVGYSLNQFTYWEVGSKGYWRADNRIKRSDSGFADNNHFEVLVYPNPSAPNLVDENGVKVTWRSPELGLRTFLLKNVTVYYVTDGILINGSYKIKDTPIGISISITPKS